jgi:predicted ATP-binding protein involved in virulence
MSKIYLERIIIKNLAPFDNDLDLIFAENKIAVLSAINGKGKTTIMSWIVDAFHTIAKKGHPEEYRDKPNDLYRISSPIYTLDQTKNSVVYLRFKYNNTNIDYIELRKENPDANFIQQDYDTLVPIADKIPFARIQNWLSSNKNFARGTSDVLSENSKDIFNSNIIAYFPAYRNELPAWLNDTYKKQTQEFTHESKYAGFFKAPIEIMGNIHNITNWIMDVILDRNIFSYNSDREKNILDSLDQMFKNILSHKISDNTSIRLGIRKRRNSATRVVIAKDNKGTTSTSTIYPNLYNMSSGEIAIVDIFAEILRQSEIKEQTSSYDGIVIIDEIDKHLHIKLQKEVLPALMAMFPQIQFIVSSHAPFFGLGLSQNQTTKSRSKIIDLDANGVEVPIESTDLYKECYDLMVSENERYKDAYEKIKATNKDVIICEGKTDMDHLKNALQKLSNTDFDNVEWVSGDGDAQLYKLLKAYSKISNKNKIIGLFDRDVTKIVSEIEKDSQPHKDFGNNVYGVCIPALSDADNISIEHYYGDTAKKDNNGRRLYFGSEFTAKGFSIESIKPPIHTKSNYKHKVSINGVIDDEVYLDSDREESKNLALSKAAFAEFAKTFTNGTNDEEFDFTVFNQIFKKIQSILNPDGFVS